MKENKLKLNPQGFNLCVENKKKATLRMGKRDVEQTLTIENQENGNTLQVQVQEVSTMTAEDAYQNPKVLNLLGYPEQPGQLKAVMEKNYPNITNQSLVTLISWK